jgi:hypothetical protein
MTTGSIGPPVPCTQTGGSWIFGGGLALASHNPKWLRMARITDGFSMKLMIRNGPLRSGNNPNLAGFLGDKQRQKAT